MASAAVLYDPRPQPNLAVIDRRYREHRQLLRLPKLRGSSVKPKIERTDAYDEGNEDKRENKQRREDHKK